jgi:hypothetical protein
MVKKFAIKRNDQNVKDVIKYYPKCLNSFELMSNLFKRAKENYIRNEKYIRNEQKSQQTGESLKIAKGIALEGSINLFELRHLDFK